LKKTFSNSPKTALMSDKLFSDDFVRDEDRKNVKQVLIDSLVTARGYLWVQAILKKTF